MFKSEYDWRSLESESMKNLKLFSFLRDYLPFLHLLLPYLLCTSCPPDVLQGCREVAQCKGVHRKIPETGSGWGGEESNQATWHLIVSFAQWVYSNDICKRVENPLSSLWVIDRVLLMLPAEGVACITQASYICRKLANKEERGQRSAKQGSAVMNGAHLVC